MWLESVADQLPGALVEQVVSPEHVALVRDDAGLTHLLCYVGHRTDGTYFQVEHIVLEPHHASIFREEPVVEDRSASDEARAMFEAEVVPFPGGDERLQELVTARGRTLPS